MKTDFWHEKWSKNEIGFHQPVVNQLLAKHADKSLGLGSGDRLFLPLCGKTLDIAWLLSKGIRVAGAELSQTAVEQLFEELEVEPMITRTSCVNHFQADAIDVYVGDIFELDRAMLGAVDAVYDRAALVALPAAMRAAYASHVNQITDCASQLLITFEYDQAMLQGPPFSIQSGDVEDLYGKEYSISLLDRIPVEGKLKGKVAANETAWLLSSRHTTIS